MLEEKMITRLVSNILMSEVSSLEKDRANDIAKHIYKELSMFRIMHIDEDNRKYIERLNRARQSLDQKIIRGWTKGEK